MAITSKNKVNDCCKVQLVTRRPKNETETTNEDNKDAASNSNDPIRERGESTE